MMIIKDESWKEREDAEARRKYEEDEDATDISLIIRRELQNPFYSLEHGSKTVDINKKFVFKTPSDGQPDDEVMNQDGDFEVMNSDGDNSVSSVVSIGLGVSRFANTGTNMLL